MKEIKRRSIESYISLFSDEEGPDTIITMTAEREGSGKRTVFL